MLKPEQVVYDRERAQVGRVEIADGVAVMRKVSKHPLSGPRLAIVDFLKVLAEEPHPNLLAPIAFSGAEDEVLVEDYPDMGALKKLDTAGSKVRSEAANGRLDRVIDFMAQISSGLGFIHRKGFVHRDVRKPNVFVKDKEEALVPVVFDYDLLTRPYFMTEGLSYGQHETPPEEFDGQIELDARHDVYQLGWMLRELTHYNGGLGPWRPVAPEAERLAGVIECSTGPLDDRYPDADSFAEELLAAA